MTEFKVRFSYKGDTCVDGIVTFTADSFQEAVETIKKKIADGDVPGNWDHWTFISNN